MSRRKRYSKEFKREALRRANENGVTDTLIAEESGGTNGSPRMHVELNVSGFVCGRVTV